MKMQAKQNPLLKTTLRIRPIWMVVGGTAIAGGLAFLAVFLFNMLGMRQQSVAAGPARYPFDIEADALQKVNFTVLDTRINSVFAEVRPFITANGSELFFCRRNHYGNMGKERDGQDIWISALEADGQWSTPRNAGPVINGKTADAISSISADGSEIVFFHEEMSPEKVLMRSKRVAGGWGRPEHMAVENYYSQDPYVDFFYSFETNMLLMAITRPDSKGGQDLYVSFPKGKNRWSEPVNMGPEVNSVRADFAPFLAADGRTLFFVSYGHNGLGGCDIFQTTRLDDSWTNWSEPRNLGEGINSDREESYFSISGDYRHIYFESYDLKKEVRDIFRADLPEVFRPEPLLHEGDEEVSVRGE